MADESKGLQNELIKIIVDKLLIGVIILLIGLLANNFVDKMKTQRAFSTELNKTRVDKIGEVWDKIGLYEGEYEVRRLAFTSAIKGSLEKTLGPLDSPAKDTPNKSSSSDVDNALADASNILRKLSKPKSLYEDILRTLNKNRLWIGENNYHEARKYLDASEALISASKGRTDEQTKELEKQKDEARANLIKIRDGLFTE